MELSLINHCENGLACRIVMQCAGAAKQAEDQKKEIVRLFLIEEIHILLG